MNELRMWQTQEQFMSLFFAGRHDTWRKFYETTFKTKAEQRPRSSRCVRPCALTETTHRNFQRPKCSGDNLTAGLLKFKIVFWKLYRPFVFDTDVKNEKNDTHHAFVIRKYLQGLLLLRSPDCPVASCAGQNKSGQSGNLFLISKLFILHTLCRVCICSVQPYMR